MFLEDEIKTADQLKQDCLNRLEMLEKKKEEIKKLEDIKSSLEGEIETANRIADNAKQDAQKRSEDLEYLQNRTQEQSEDVKELEKKKKSLEAKIIRTSQEVYDVEQDAQKRLETLEKEKGQIEQEEKRLKQLRENVVEEMIPFYAIRRGRQQTLKKLEQENDIKKREVERLNEEISRKQQVIRYSSTIRGRVYPVTPSEPTSVVTVTNRSTPSDHPVIFSERLTEMWN